MKKIRIRRCRNRDETTARMLAAQDADHDHPMRDEEAVEAFAYLRELERERVADRPL